MKTYESKFTEQDCTYMRELIWKNALDLFKKRKGQSASSIIKMQRKFINELYLKGGKNSNKYKSVELLQNYFKNPNKHLAEQIFYNTIRKKTLI